MFLDSLEKEAMTFIRHHEPSVGAYALAFSGGKDSVVLHDLTRRAGVQFTMHYCNTTIDPPEVLRFIKKHYPECRILRSPKSFWQWIMHFGRKSPKGLPTRTGRWCCDVLKEKPARGEGQYHLVGVRAQESSMRKKYPRVDMHNRHHYFMFKPLYYWTVEDIWSYIHKYDLPYLKFYEGQGCRRVGCVVCPMQSPMNKLRSQRDFPGFWKLAKIYSNKLYDAYHETVEWIGRFENGDELYDWWVSDLSVEVFLEKKKILS